MTIAQLLHFAVRNLSYTFTATGYLVTCYTNNPCHLWLRWTNIVPQKHVNTRILRGAPVGTYIDQCFVVFTDVEQNEAGDTFTHTFTLEPWPSCERRWFYFWGTVDGQLSPSVSAIFTKHRPYRDVFYSDPGSGLTTVDGYAARINIGDTWDQIHDGPGNSANTGAGGFYAQIQSSTTPNTYLLIYRPIMTFNLAIIPKENDILAAELYLYIHEKQDTANNCPAWTILTCSKGIYNDIYPDDYGSIGVANLTDIKPHSALTTGQYNVFTFRPDYLYYLTKGGLIALAFCEYNYDATGFEPPWSRSFIMRAQAYSADAPYSWVRPYLVVYHSPKGV